MAIAEVTGQRNTVSGSANNAYPGNVTIGSLLVMAGAGPMASTTSVTASGAGAPTAWAVMQIATGAGAGGLYLAWGVAAATGACTVTLTGATTPSTTVTEFTGASAVAAFPLPGWARGSGTAVTAAMPGVTAGSLVIGAMVYGTTNTTITQDGAWTLCGEYETYSVNYPHSLINQIASGSGTLTATWTLGAARTWAALAVLIQPTTTPSGGGGSYAFIG